MSLGYSIKDYILLAVLFVESFAQGAQRKEVIIALFVKRFKFFMTEVPILLYWKDTVFVTQFFL